jgi:uncharacterized membrane protein
MADRPVFLYAAVYEIADAEADYEAVFDLHAAGAIGTFDSAVIRKEADGKVRVTKTEKPTQHGAWTGAAVGALVGIIFPPAIIGSAIVGAGAGGLTGHLTRGISRGDLKDLGDGLDEGSAAVIVLGESKIEEQLERAYEAGEQADREADRRRRRRARARDPGGRQRDIASSECPSAACSLPSAGSLPAASPLTAAFRTKCGSSGGSCLHGKEQRAQPWMGTTAWLPFAMGLLPVEALAAPPGQLRSSVRRAVPADLRRVRPEQRRGCSPTPSRRAVGLARPCRFGCPRWRTWIKLACRCGGDLPNGDGDW